MQGLHTLQPAPYSTKNKKRRGRGNSSGHGTYSGRGVKGQKARAGGKSGLTARAMKPYLLRIPKARGFVSLRKTVEVVSLGALATAFSDGDQVTPQMLRKKGLIKSRRSLVKILAGGTFNKRLTVSANAFSKEAEERITAASGTVTRIADKSKVQRAAKSAPEKK